MILDNREIAACIWTGVISLWYWSKPTIRSAVKHVIARLFRPAILIPLLAMFLWIGLEIAVGTRLSLWNTDLALSTVVWTVGSATVLCFNCVKAAKEPDFFKRILLGTLAVTVFVEFFMNLYVFSLPVELVLQLAIIILALVAAVTGARMQDEKIKNTCELLLVLIVIWMLFYSARQAYLHWEQIDKQSLYLELGLPVWLTLGIIPYLFLFSIVLAYDLAFRRINALDAQAPAKYRAGVTLLCSFHVRFRDLSGFSAYWLNSLAKAANFRAAREVIREFRLRRRETALAEQAKMERLQRNAGMQGTDDDGRRLDQREFRETMDALLWLHTCQNGWYERSGGRYREDLLSILDDSFVRHGLPEESGITLRVSQDGQSWYAWRRTVTGWCFAIGAQGPPPICWEHDGSEPPKGFPGEDPVWGEHPFSDYCNPNWY